MSTQDTDLVVEITPDITVVTDTKPEPIVESKPEKVETIPIEPIEDLRKQFETLKQESDANKTARLHAETVARQSQEEASKAREEVAKAKVEVVDSAMSAIDTALSAAQSEADSAEAEYKSAFESGDGAKMAQSQRKMARAEAKIQRFDEAKADLEVRRAEEPKPTTRAPERTAQPTEHDQFEQTISSATPRSQAWLRSHPEYVKDEKLNRKANAAHNMALAEGHIADSDSYFDFCEQFLELKTDARPNGKPQARTKPMPGAPVSRESISMNGSLSPTQVVLTKGEQNSSTDGTIVWNYTDPKLGAVKGEPIGHREMGRRKLALQKQGAYDRSFTES